MLTFLLVLPLLAQAASPELALENLRGQRQSMGDYIGNGDWVVVNVWSPTCSACVRELPSMERFHARNRDEGVIVLGVTIDFPSFGYGRPDIIRAFLERHPLDYPIFLADMELASELIGHRLVGIPLTVIYHPDGRVLARWPGPINVAEIESFMENYQDYTDDWILQH